MYIPIDLFGVFFSRGVGVAFGLICLFLVFYKCWGLLWFICFGFWFLLAFVGGSALECFAW